MWDDTGISGTRKNKTEFLSPGFGNMPIEISKSKTGLMALTLCGIEQCVYFEGILLWEAYRKEE